MDKAAEMAIASLMGAYGKYFVEDYTTQVMNHLKGSVPVETDYLQGFISEQLAPHFSVQNGVKIDAINPVTRFLHECATYSQEHAIDNAEDRSVYDQVKNLPSIHHEEIGKLVYQSAQLYQKTVDETLLSVVVNDARTAAESIVTGAQARISQVETGGRVHQFTWGILSDGLWLNGALMKAFDLASIFRPGEQVAPFYAKVGFDFARNYAAAPIISEEEGGAAGNFDLLISHADNAVLTSGDVSPTAAPLVDLMFNPGAMAFAIDRWELGAKDPVALIAAVSELSSLAVVIPHLIDVSGQIEGDDLLHSAVVERLHSANNVVTLCLSAFEALRETTYADTLIIAVTTNSNDPTVDVFANNDMINTYRSAGGDEADLIHLGSYLDPRKGMPPQNGGWTMSWAMARRDEIIANSIASEDERVTALRNNDAAVIQDLVQNNLRSLVTSYADASGLHEIPNPVRLKINEIARRVTNTPEGQSFSLEGEVVDLLLQTIDDPFLSQVATRFTSFAAHEDESVRNNARALAVAATAVDDAVGFLAYLDA